MNSAYMCRALTKQFLDMATGVNVKYEMPNKTNNTLPAIVFRLPATQSVDIAIANELLSERLLIAVTIRAKTARELSAYVELIKWATEATAWRYLSYNEQFVNGKNIGVMTLVFYNSIDAELVEQYNNEQAIRMAQVFADRLIFLTTEYSRILGVPTPDRLAIHTMEDIGEEQKDYYTPAELRDILQRLADRYLFKTTVFKADGTIEADKYVVPELK